MVFFNSSLKGKFLGDKKYFERDFILSQLNNRKGINQEIYERALNGLEYLSQMRNMGLDPIFKGGSAVQLLIPERIQRLSIDIDLVIDSSEEEITSTLNLIHNKFNQKIYNFDRVGSKDLPPHLILYNIYIPSLFSEELSKIALDFLLHRPNYKIQQTPIKTFIYESNLTVKTPTINSLLGDKLTVICPHTIGKKMSENPLNFAKQIYDIATLLEYSNNFADIFDAFYDVFIFEKETRSLQDLSFDNVINDLIEICKLFALIKHLPDWIQDKDIIEKSDFLKRGINGLNPYTSTNLRLDLLTTRTISAKIAFLAKLMLLQNEKNLTVKHIPMEIFQQENPNINNLIQDKKVIDDIIGKLNKLNQEEIYHLQLKEIKKIDPLGLLFWFGCYFPFEFLQIIK